VKRLGQTNRRHIDDAPSHMIEITPFSPQHARGVVSTILPIQQDEFGIPITLDEQPDLADVAGFYQRGAGNFWIALADTEVVGTIALLDIGNHQGALRKMFVKARHRGPEHGVAQRLLGALLDWCWARGIHEVFLGTTAQFRAAHRFYEKNGFREVPRAELPSRFPVMSVDTKFYAMALPTWRLATPPNSSHNTEE
jgi:N-acetylglutamate synthase-like GNAT family acetyltransferase